MLITKRIIIFVGLCCGLFFLCCTSLQDYPRHEIVIIGGGLMGSSAAWQLADEGLKVTLLEKQSNIYTSGSSLGEARIARSFGGKNDKWSYLHNRTVDLAKNLMTYLNTTEPDSHSMTDIYNTSPVTYIRNKSRLESVQNQISEQTDSVLIATNMQEGLELFDANLPDSVFLLREYKEFSGTINPSKIIQKMHLAIQHKGSTISYNTKVTKLVKDKSGFKIEMIDTYSNEKKIILTDKVIVAAGPYNGELLLNTVPYFDKLIDIKRVFVSFFRLKADTWNTLEDSIKEKLVDAYPCINSTSGTREGANFSMVESRDDTGNPLIKIGGHFQRSEIHELDSTWKQKLSEEEIEWSRKHILRYWKFIDLQVSPEDLVYEDGYSCVYSLSKNEVPYVTPAKLDGKMDRSLIVLGAMSGVGAKGCLGSGEIASHYLLGRIEDHELYNITKEAMGYERLKNDIEELGHHVD